MVKEFYRELGVPENASQQAIRKAYRTLAQQRHPDKDTGNNESFQRLQQAYEVLGDEAKRAQYDATGQAPRRVDNTETEAREMIIQLLLQMIDQIAELEYFDFIREAKNVIEGAKRESSDKAYVIRLNAETAVKKRRQAAERIKRKEGKENMLAMMLEQNALWVEQKAASEASQHQRRADISARALELLSEYECSTKEKSFVNATIFFSSGGYGASTV